uniref:Uncharacterized protein n=1 Tax=Heterorhabditis bacteriophora TaxID=37862 RepID=A0A1I7WI85_HETBA
MKLYILFTLFALFLKSFSFPTRTFSNAFNMLEKWENNVFRTVTN